MNVEINERELQEAIEKELEKETGLKIGEQNEIPFDELFTEDFMRLYTEFEAFEQLIEESPWDVESEDDFWDIPDEPFDEYISERTDFPAWKVMGQTALQRYMERKLE